MALNACILVVHDARLAVAVMQVYGDSDAPDYSFVSMAECHLS